MDSVNAGTARFEEVEILGIPALFTTLRVLVEHFGTVLTASPIHLPEKGYLDLSPGNFKEQGIGQLTVAEFEAK